MIREATEQDIPRLVEMGEQFRETIYADYLSQNPDKMKELATKLIANKGLLVSEHEGRIVAMMGFVIYDHFISGDKTWGEVFWWAERPREGMKLFNEAEKRGREADCKHLQMIAPNARVSKIYARRGYQRVEESWQKTL